MIRARCYVLEDNLRCPSGVSYVLQNRQVMKKNFPQVFEASQVRPVNDYPARLYQMLCEMAPPQVDESDGRRVDAGNLQQRLLRTLIFSPTNGRRVGRRSRLGGGR